jgi:putative ABC transport system permease protein
MLRNYLTVALRNLAANKVNAAINIGGLAVGLAACLAIVLLVRDELSYERWLPHADRIAAVESTFLVPGREALSFAAAPGPMKAALEKDFTSDLERVVRVYQDEDSPVRVADRQFSTTISFVDPGFFDVFDLPMAAGDRAAALANNASVVLSQTTARKYFGDGPAVGNTITVGGKLVFTVVGVFADIPHNSHLVLDAIALLDPQRYSKDRPGLLERWTSVNVRLYALLRSPDALARVAADLPAFVDRNVVFEVPGLTERPSSLVSFELRPLLDIHLHGDKQGYANLGSFTAVLAFAGIALLILVIACINFVNLATARATMRAREVAMRKVVGATRAQLVGQHLGEAVLTALFALVIAVALVELWLPTFNSFIKKDLRLDLLGDPGMLAIMLGLIVCVGAIGGLYPAIYLSRFRPASVLRANKSSAQGSSRLRSALVVFQFAISISLIVCTATIYFQTVYARTLDPGFRSEHRLTLKGLDALAGNQARATLKRELAALAGVRGVALSSDTPPLGSNSNTLLYPTAQIGEEKYIVETIRVDPDFFGVYGVAPIAGRLFASDRPSDFQPKDDQTGELRQSIVVNRALVAKLGAARPEDVIGRVLWEVNEPGKPMTVTTIVGVVPDLHLRSARAAITPLLYQAGGPDHSFDTLTAHVAPDRTREVADAIAGIWARVSGGSPIHLAFVDDDLAKQYDGDEQRGKMFAGFAVFAIVIACLGLYGLASFSAQRRTKEIGMRKVLGASILDIVRLLVWQFSRPVLLANLIAWPVAFYVMREWLAGFRYAIDLTSPPVLAGIFGGAATLALLIAWLTTAGHAYRVARGSPSGALRAE